MKAGIIGAGIAGIATAIRLRNKGYSVTIFDQNPYAGGKLTEISGSGYRFDAGPSLFTLPHQVDDLFILSGRNPRQFFNYYNTDTSCHYFWDDGMGIKAFTDINRYTAEIEEKLGVSKDVLLAQLQLSKRLFERTGTLFLDHSLHRLSTYFSKDALRALFSLSPGFLFRSMHAQHEAHLSHPKLVQIFDRYATYNGSDPYQAPAILTMIPHLEHGIGTFLPKGGMHQISQSLYHLALSCGVEFRLSEKVTAIQHKGKAVKGIETDKGVFDFDIVVSNIDVFPTYRNLLPDIAAPERILNQPRSSSALIFYWGIADAFAELGLHNIFFSQDYKKEFDQIFKEGIIPDDPTVYVNITAKHERQDAPQGCENWFVLINTPPDTGQPWDKWIPQAKEIILRKLSKVLNRDISSLIQFESFLDPVLIQIRTGSWQGALYGNSSNNPFAAFLRHSNKSSRLKGLYFCGGSVHPGGGIPLCLKSAKIVSELVPFAHD